MNSVRLDWTASTDNVGVTGVELPEDEALLQQRNGALVAGQQFLGFAADRRHLVGRLARPLKLELLELPEARRHAGTPRARDEEQVYSAEAAAAKVAEICNPLLGGHVRVSVRRRLTATGISSTFDVERAYVVPGLHGLLYGAGGAGGTTGIVPNSSCAVRAWMSSPAAKAPA